jgi:hypothetical protein
MHSDTADGNGRGEVWYIPMICKRKHRLQTEVTFDPIPLGMEFGRLAQNPAHTCIVRKTGMVASRLHNPHPHHSIPGGFVTLWADRAAPQ